MCSSLTFRHGPSYKEYTEAILKHLTEVTLRHWDVSMRSLGAQSLKKVCELNLEEHGPQMLGRLSVLLRSVDTTDVHGAILALSELAESFRDSKSEKLKPERQKVCKTTTRFIQPLIYKPGICLAEYCPTVYVF